MTARLVQAQKRQRLDHLSGFSKVSGSDSGQSVQTCQTGQAPVYLELECNLSVDGYVAPSRLVRYRRPLSS